MQTCNLRNSIYNMSKMKITTLMTETTGDQLRSTRSVYIVVVVKFWSAAPKHPPVSTPSVFKAQLLFQMRLVTVKKKQKPQSVSPVLVM